MTTLQYEDSGYRKKQLQKEKDEFAIGFAECLEKYQGGTPNLKVLKELLEIYKKEKGL